MAGLKDQRREHPGVRALEPPEPPGIPPFSRGETPASNSFGTPKPGDGVQMAGRHLDVRASRGVPPGPHGRTRGPWAGGAAWPRRCVVCFWGPGGRRTQLCGHERHPGISLTSNVTTAGSSSRRPRAVVWGAEELGVGWNRGAVRAGLVVTAAAPPARASSDRDAGAWLFFPSLGFGKRAEAGPPAGPASPGRGLLPTAGEKPLAKPGAACRAASPRGAGARGSSVGGGSPRAPTGAWRVGDRVVKAALPPARCLPRGPQAALPFPRRVLAARAGTGRQPSGHP